MSFTFSLGGCSPSNMIRTDRTSPLFHPVLPLTRSLPSYLQRRGSGNVFPSLINAVHGRAVRMSTLPLVPGDRAGRPVCGRRTCLYHRFQLAHLLRDKGQGNRENQIVVGGSKNATDISASSIA